MGTRKRVTICRYQRQDAALSPGFGPLGIFDNDGGGGAAVKERKAPVLNHSQCIMREREIEAELTRLQEFEGTLSPEDEDYFDRLTSEFTEVYEHRKRLERESKLGRIRDAAKSGNLSNVPGGYGPGSQVQPGAHDEDGYDFDTFVAPDSAQDYVAHRGGNGPDPWDISRIRTFGRGRDDLNAELASRAAVAIEKMPQATDRIREAATSILENWDDKDGKIAKMVLASSSPAYVRAFSKLAQNRGYLLTEAEKRAVDQVRAMSLTDSAGGYLVPFQLDPTVIVTANGSLNEIRQIARQVIATGDTWNGVSSGAVSWSWDPETTVVSDDSTTFAQPSIPVYKANGFVPITIEALEDAQNVAGTVANLLAEGRDVLEAAAFITGTGTGQPTGIVTALTGTGSVVASATADTLAVADVYSTQGGLPARFRRRASWLANNLIYNKFRQFDTAGGSALWAQLAADRPPLLLGRAVYEAEDMDGVINATVDNYVAVLGDFSNYVIADRIGMTVEFIPHLMGSGVAGGSIATNPTPTVFRPVGQRAWYAYYRVGADSVNDGAFRMLNVT